MTGPLDPVSVSVMWDRLISMADEGATALVRTSFSTLVREGNDLSVVIFDGAGRMLAQSARCIPVFIGAAPITLRAMLAKHPPETLRPGDVVISNDPAVGTGHLFDLAVMRPAFRDGRLVGYAMSITHLPDIGGMGFSAAATEVYHEGLRLPILKLAEAGRLNPDILELIALNVRSPELVLGDIHASLGCAAVVCRQILEFLEEHDAADLQALGDAVIGRTEAAVRAAFRALPDGVFESETEVEAFDETRRLRCRIEKRGDRLAVDFAGSGPCVRAGINVPFPYTRAMALYAVKCATTPALPNNAGATAPVEVSAPEGSVLHALAPAPTAGRHVIGHFVPPLVHAALAPILPGAVSAASGLMDILTLQGRRPDGAPMTAAYFASGGFGGMEGQDGRATLPGSSNMGAMPVEVFEAETDMLVERKTLRPDSGGAGRYVGGAGQSVVLRNDTGHDMTVFGMANRTAFAAGGLFGGGPGALREHWIDDRRVDGQGRHVLAPGARLRLEQAGGGGYGPPGQRPAERIAEDLARGLLTEAGAARAGLAGADRPAGPESPPSRGPMPKPDPFG